MHILLVVSYDSFFNSKSHIHFFQAFLVITIAIACIYASQDESVFGNLNESPAAASPHDHQTILKKLLKLKKWLG